jgi:2-oxo-4-hydroxy-4-carboxy-5-ureidoimidazoline decarboxylase
MERRWKKRMNPVLARWNELGVDEAAEEILSCCGAKAWARGMTARRPILDEARLLAASDEIWHSLAESDWLEAFDSHPRIGGSASLAISTKKSAAWSAEEQGKVAMAREEVMRALAEGNRMYEQRFNQIFIVCANGKTATEILEILQRRLKNDEMTELREAAEQQRQIAQLRLRKWLAS